MVDILPFLIALVVAALGKHLVTRLFFMRVYPVVRSNQRKSERADARYEAMDTSDMTANQLTELKLKLQKEEGISFRPLATLLGGLFLMWGISIALVWLASAKFGGAFAEPIWWVASSYLGVKFLFSMATTIRSKGKAMPTLGAAGRWTAIGCVTLVGVGVLAPLALLYILAPVGLVTFAMIYSFVSWVLWRLFPYKLDDLPKVAMLFL